MKKNSMSLRGASISERRSNLVILSFGIASLALAMTTIVLPAHAAPLFPPQGQVQIILTPEFPEPNQAVTVTAQSFSFDLDTTFLSWSSNGKNVTSGKGVKSYSFNTGPAGSLHRVSVSANAKGTTFSDTLSFRVSDILLTWEAQTYTPPGYRGRALPTSGALVRVYAFPELFVSASQTANPDNLVYQWRLDDQDMRDQSGRGKKSFSLRAANGKGVTHRVSVMVTSEDKSASVFAKTDIRVEDPHVLFYEDKILEGPRYERSSLQFSVSAGEELRLRAEPYFFLTGSVDALSYRWHVNGRLVEDASKPRQFLLRTERGSKGIYHAALDIENPFQLFQRGNGSVIINVQ